MRDSECQQESRFLYRVCFKGPLLIRKLYYTELGRIQSNSLFPWHDIVIYTQFHNYFYFTTLALCVFQNELIFSWTNGVLDYNENFINRINLLSDTDAWQRGRGSINITSIRETDEGWYECKVIFPNRTPSSKPNGTWFHLLVEGRHNTIMHILRSYLIPLIYGPSYSQNTGWPGEVNLGKKDLQGSQNENNHVHQLLLPDFKVHSNHFLTRLSLLGIFLSQRKIMIGLCELYWRCSILREN